MLWLQTIILGCADTGLILWAAWSFANHLRNTNGDDFDD